MPRQVRYSSTSSKGREIGGLNFLAGPAVHVEELVQWAAEFFGSQRVAEPTRQHLREVVGWAVEEGLLVEENGQITAP